MWRIPVFLPPCQTFRKPCWRDPRKTSETFPPYNCGGAASSFLPKHSFLRSSSREDGWINGMEGNRKSYHSTGPNLSSSLLRRQILSLRVQHTRVTRKRLCFGFISVSRMEFHRSPLFSARRLTRFVFTAFSNHDAKTCRKNLYQQRGCFCKEKVTKTCPPSCREIQKSLKNFFIL